LEQVSDNIISIMPKKSILDLSRESPAMYGGDHCLTGLWYFLHGYEMGLPWPRDDAQPEVPACFADWVAYRLHLRDNWSGFWHRLILSRTRDEAAALDRFYELRDGFYSRKATLVATIREGQGEYLVRKSGVEGHYEECIEKLPKSLGVVVYTGDPGFFLEADDNEHFCYNGRFFCAFDSFSPNSRVDIFHVHEEQIWARCSLKNKRHKTNL
jgi:hypothetical protein